MINAKQVNTMDNLARQGFLFKKGKKTMKNILANITSNTKLNQYISMIDGFEWKKRWFALKQDDMTLYYYVNQQVVCCNR